MNREKTKQEAEFLLSNILYGATYDVIVHLIFPQNI